MKFSTWYRISIPVTPFIRASKDLVRPNMQLYFCPVSYLKAPVGTRRMGSESETNVVDSQLRFHGVTGWRVADASIFPAITSGIPMRQRLWWEKKRQA